MHTSSASLGVYLVPSLPPLIGRSECSSLGTIFFQHGARCVGELHLKEVLIMENHKAKLKHLLEDALVWLFLSYFIS